MGGWSQMPTCIGAEMWNELYFSLVMVLLKLRSSVSFFPFGIFPVPSFPHCHNYLTKIWTHVREDVLGFSNELASVHGHGVLPGQASQARTAVMHCD